MSTRLLITMLVMVTFIFSGTVLAAQHGQRPGPQTAPSQYRPDTTPPAPATDRQNNSYRQQYQQERQDAEHRRDQQGTENGQVDPAEMLDENASPIAGTATANAGEGEATAEAVKETIREETGQEIPEPPEPEE